MKLKSYFAKDIKNKVELANQCVEIANSAKFNTDFNDVYEHLFFGDNLMLVFAFDDDNKMQGFSSLFITKEQDGTPHIHLNGVIVSPKCQGKGIAKLMVSRAVGYVYGLFNKKFNDDFKVSLSARTQNPAIYRLMQKVSSNVSPSVKGKVNKKHFAIVKMMDSQLKPFLGLYNDDFIVKNAYPSSKVQADINNQSVKVLFNKLNAYDAFIIFGEKAINLDKQQVALGIIDAKETTQTQTKTKTNNCSNNDEYIK